MGIPPDGGGRRQKHVSGKTITKSGAVVVIVFFFFLNSSSIPVGIRMDRPAGYLLHKYLRDPYYLNPVFTRRRKDIVLTSYEAGETAS